MANGGGDEEELPQCMICYTDLAHPCVTPCGHDEICGTCHLRLRHLHSDKHCPLCKQENQQLIVDAFDSIKPFAEYPLWGNELGSDFAYRDDVGMFFPAGHYQAEVLPLFGFHCGMCTSFDGATPTVTPDASAHEEADRNNPHKKKSKGGAPSPIRALQEHLRNKHRTTLCQLCVDFKRDFVSRLPRFTSGQLKHHLAKGDGEDSGFRGHPLCEFCRPKRFYDLTQLHMHLQKDHYKCHVCEKQGLANQYFRDYSALEKHFDRQHFLCKDVQCIQARFMVFENEIDLRAHELSIHGGTSTGSTKIQVEFRVRREGYSGAGYENQTIPSEDDFQYGLDGQAFVPESLPQGAGVGPDEATSHPQHFQRTAELRAQAAEIRAVQNMQSREEAFPSLGEANNQNFRMGWTSTGTMQRITKKQTDSTSAEHFPSLPTASSGSTRTVAAKLRKGGVSGGRQFSAMRQAAMGSASTPTNKNWSTASLSSQQTTSSSVTTPYLTSSATGAQLNRQTNLAAENFPSLGRASQTRASYPTALNGRTAQIHSYSAPSMSTDNFPSLGSASKTRATYPTSSIDTKKNPPSVNDVTHFPPPAKSSAKANTVREKLLGNRKPAPAMNMANFPPALANKQSLQQGMATVENMKGSLGPNKYKELKNLTKEFAADGLSPQAYVDHAASLFDGGYGDSDFWDFVPSLLISCPNQGSAAQAIRYMKDLKAANMATSSPAPATTWTASPTLPTPSSVPVATSQLAPSAYAMGYSVPASKAPSGRAQSRAVGSQSAGKSAWGSNDSSVIRAKATPASVSVAAANERPQTGTATKYMAKEKKQQSNPTSNTNNGGTVGKKKNKKKNDELRALAFGK